MCPAHLVAQDPLCLAQPLSSTCTLGLGDTLCFCALKVLQKWPEANKPISHEDGSPVCCLGALASRGPFCTIEHVRLEEQGYRGRDAR